MTSEDLKLLSLLLFEFHRRETSATVMNTIAAVSKVIHKVEKTIRVRKKGFKVIYGEFSESGLGRRDRMLMLSQ